MRTWEMIKVLAENPKLQFENGIHVVKISDSTKKVVWVQDDGDEDSFIIYSHAPGAVDSLHIDWELVPQEVTWQEAIQAWIDGKDIRVECDGATYEQVNSCGLGCYEGRNKGLYPRFFKVGKWYIK